MSADPTGRAIRRVLTFSEIEAHDPTPADVGLVNVVDDLVARGLLARLAGGRITVTATGLERAALGESDDERTELGLRAMRRWVRLGLRPGADARAALEQVGRLLGVPRSRPRAAMDVTAGELADAG